MNNFNSILYLALTSVKRAPKSVISSLYRALGSDITDFDSVNSLLSSLNKNDYVLSDKNVDDAKKIWQYHVDSKVHILTYKDSAYPNSLRTVKNFPIAIFLKGNINILNNLPGVAVVGARKATSKGRIIASRISEYLAENGWVVVSGLAQGIDAAAHQGCLNAKGKTIAVLAGGLDKPKPKMNEELGYEIIKSNGAWVSEYPLGYPTKRENFVPRNRIQIGLSAGSIIVEAGLKSGSISQANFCIDSKKALFAVVPQTQENKLNLLSEGTEYLVRDKAAYPVRSKEDYTEIIKIINSHKEYSVMHS